MKHAVFAAYAGLSVDSETPGLRTAYIPALGLDLVDTTGIRAIDILMFPAATVRFT